MYINLLVTFPLSHAHMHAVILRTPERTHTLCLVFSHISDNIVFPEAAVLVECLLWRSQQKPGHPKPTCESGLACFGFFKRLRQCDGARGAINSLMTNPFFLSPLSLPGTPRNSRWPARNCLPTECNFGGGGAHMHHLDSLGLMRPDNQTFRDVS